MQKPGLKTPHAGRTTPETNWFVYNLISFSIFVEEFFTYASSLLTVV